MLKSFVVSSCLFTVGAILCLDPSRAQLTMTSVGGGFGGAAAVFSGAMEANNTNVQIYVGLDPPTLAYSGNVFRVCDVATGADCANATAAAGIVTLPTIAGGACNNSGNQCNVNILYDTSAQTNCNLGTDPCHFFQATNAKRPVLFVGPPHYMIFDGTNTVICQPANYGPSGGSSGIAQPFTVSVVLNQNGTSGNTIFSDGVNVEYDGGGASGINMYAGSASLMQASTHGNWYATQYVANGATSSITINASPTSSPPNPGTSGLGATFCLGAFNSAPTFPWPGKIREFGLWSGAVGNTTNQAMIANQKVRGGF